MNRLLGSETEKKRQMSDGERERNGERGQSLSEKAQVKPGLDCL